MANVNIGGDAADASYRYKMPRLQTKIEGRGNGIKTVIVNMVEIAKALHINPAYPTKFFGIELGAQSKFNVKTERAIVNGAHQAGDLVKVLEKFIQIFILCPTCKLPEIAMEVGKKNIKIDCAACGHNGNLQTAHKLTIYIQKNEQDDKKKKKDKKEKKNKKKKGEDEAVAAVAVQKPKKKKEVEVEWFTDTSKEAQAERKEHEFSELKKGGGKSVDKILDLAKEDSKADSPVTVLKVFLATGDDEAGRSMDAIVSEVRRLQIARGLDEPQKLKVLLEGLIDTTDIKSVPGQYAKHADVLRVFAKSSASTLIECIVEQVGATEPQLASRMPIILQKLYEAEVLEEKTILTWANSPPESSWLVSKEVATSIREKAKPFTDWLQDADEESGDEEED